MLLNIKAFISGVQREFNRISWPSFQETRVTTIVVAILALVMAIYFVVVDQVIIKILSFMLGV